MQKQYKEFLYTGRRHPDSPDVNILPHLLYYSFSPTLPTCPSTHVLFPITLESNLQAWCTFDFSSQNLRNCYTILHFAKFSLPFSKPDLNSVSELVLSPINRRWYHLLTLPQSSVVFPKLSSPEERPFIMKW